MGTNIATRWRRGSTNYLFYSRIATSGHLDHVHCETIDNRPFDACMHAWHYITESCFNSLTDAEKAMARGKYGIVKDSGWYTTYLVDGQYTYYKFNPEAIVECFNQACSDIRCSGVVCNNICEDYDLYDSHCEDGVCIKGALIETNNRNICGYDPCRDVVCDDKCYGMDMYSEVCEEGECLPDRLLEPNSEYCGYIPPSPDPDPEPDPEPDPDDMSGTILALIVIAALFVIILGSIK